jgi:hypothetical protein
MQTPSFEQIILLSVFILVPLIKFVMQRVRRRDQILEEEPVTQIHQRAQPTATTPPPTPRASRSQVRGSQAPTVSTPLPTINFTKSSLVGTKGDVQRGIIIMTILGPCRAFDPPGYFS